MKNTPEQARKIKQMMRTRRAQLRSPGPRRFPKYQDGMSTKTYIDRFRALNMSCAVFAASEFNLGA